MRTLIQVTADLASVASCAATACFGVEAWNSIQDVILFSSDGNFLQINCQGKYIETAPQASHDPEFMKRKGKRASRRQRCQKVCRYRYLDPWKPLSFSAAGLDLEELHLSGHGSTNFFDFKHFLEVEGYCRCLWWGSLNNFHSKYLLWFLAK